jgi:ATP adenylyltransferase
VGAAEVQKGPFINPRPDEVILDHVGPYHRLMLNKFCLYRPMLVLPTRDFALQSDDLDAHDLAATWALLHAYTTFEPLVMYNRGVNGGSSQGHKHLQLFPVPPLEPFHGKASSLWPGRATSSEVVADSIAHVPFKHFVLRIPAGATAATVIAMHERLLALTRQAHVDAGHDADGDYNVTMTKEWLALIPRTTAGPPDGPFGTSTVGMLGLPAIRDETDRKKWEQFGESKFLAHLGIPIDS